MEFSYRISESDSTQAWKVRLGKRRLPLPVVIPVAMVTFWMFILVCLFCLWAVVQKSATAAKVAEYSYSDLYEKVQTGEVQDVTIQGDELKGHLKASPKGEFHTTLPANHEDLVKAMIAARVNIAIKQPQGEGVLKPLLLNLGPFVLLLGIICVCIYFAVRFAARSGLAGLRPIYRRDPEMQGEFTVEITPQGIATRNTAGTSSKSGWNIYEFWREKKDLIVLVMRSGGYFALNVANLADAQRNELRGILATALPKK